MLPISSNSTNDGNGSSELISVNGNSNITSNSSYYAVYGGSSHLPANNTNSTAVGMSCYSSYPSNYGSQQLYPTQVIMTMSEKRYEY